MPFGLYVVYGCFHVAASELSSCDRNTYGPQSLKYLPRGPLQKALADPWSREDLQGQLQGRSSANLSVSQMAQGWILRTGF